MMTFAEKRGEVGGECVDELPALFGVRLRWLPVYGSGSLAHFVLPAVSLSTIIMGRLARLVRSSMLEVLGQDYVRTARAKGLGESRVLVVHALKNASIPIVTLLGLQFAQLLGGAVKANPLIPVLLRMMGNPGARKLAGVMAAVGLAQNMAALRALGTVGIQKGHMALHARNLAVSAGAKGSAVEEVARALIAAGEIKLHRAQEIVANMVAKRGPSAVT